MSITFEEAKGLERGQTLHHDRERNADGSCRRWRVNGKAKTWKREPHRVSVPLKHGLYAYGYVTEKSLGEVHLEEDCPMEKGRPIRVTIEATVYGPMTDICASCGGPEGIGHWIESRVAKTNVFLVHNIGVVGRGSAKETKKPVQKVHVLLVEDVQDEMGVHVFESADHARTIKDKLEGTELRGPVRVFEKQVRPSVPIPVKGAVREREGQPAEVEVTCPFCETILSVMCPIGEQECPFCGMGGWTIEV